MVIMTKQAVLFVDHGEKFRAPNGYIGKCPDWVTKTRQFKHLVKDGVIVSTESTSDKAMNEAAEKSSKKPPKKPKAEQESGGQESTESTSDKAYKE